MKLFRFSVASLSLLMAGVLAAQTPQPPQAPGAPRTGQPAAQASDAADMTIVGCLAQAAGAADGFTLTVTPPPNAQAAAGAAGAVADAARATAKEKANPSDATRTANAASAPKSYKIVGLGADQLKAHVNHQVELKGRLNASALAQSSMPSTPQEFHASSVKMVSATCPPAK